MWYKFIVTTLFVWALSMAIASGTWIGRYMEKQELQKHAVAALCGTYEPNAQGDMVFHWMQTDFSTLGKATAQVPHGK